MRKIAEARVDIHLTVGIETRRVHPNAALEVPVDGNPRRAGVPPIPVDILERVAVSGALHKSARLVRDRIVRCIGEWAERIVADINAVGVHVVLGAGRTVLEIVAPTMLRHPRAFHEWLDRRVAVVLTESLPPVLFRFESE